MVLAPSHDSIGLVNLMSELESRLTGTSPSPRLAADLANSIPEAETIVLIVFDGLGLAQLSHPAAKSLAPAVAGTLEAPFPTTTSVSLATVATGLSPSQHGIVAHLSWLPEHEQVVNTLKWVNLRGERVTHDYAAMLPRPNLWERIREGGLEPITVQPGPFQGSPLSRMLYRGARFEPVFDTDDLVRATLQLAEEPGRLIFTYVWQVDFAGHVHGLESEEFSEAMTLADDVWQRIADGLPPGVAMVGTADHGLVEYPEASKVVMRDERYTGLRFAGDTRGLHLWGDPEVIEEFASEMGGQLVDPATLLGPDPSPATTARLGDALLLAPNGKVLLPPGFDKRLRCYHGGLARAEVEIPLLIG